MKILFVYPAHSKASLTYGSDFKIEALGILSLSSYMIREGHETCIIDQNLTPCASDHIFRICATFNPDVVGMSVSYANMQNALTLAKQIKKTFLTPVIVGGCYPTSHPDVVTNPEFDIAVTGEGEETLKEIMLYCSGKAALEHISGISYYHDNRVVINKPRPRIQCLDDLPFPDRRFTDPKKLKLRLFYPPKRLFPVPVTMITSRGCGMKCGFCFSPVMWGGCWIGRSPENIVEEIKLLKKQFGINQIFFVDEEINYDRDRALELYHRIKKEKLDIHWGTSTSVCKTDLKVAQAMVDAGLTCVFIGYESGSPEILSKLAKKYDPQEGLRLTRFFQKKGVFISGNFMLGLPWESRDTLKETYAFAKKLRLDIPTATFHRPQPGSAFYHLSVRKQLFSPESYDEICYNPYLPAAKTFFLSKNEVEKAVSRFFLTIFSDVRYWLRIFIRMIAHPLRIPTYLPFYFMVFFNGLKSYAKNVMTRR